MCVCVCQLSEHFEYMWDDGVAPEPALDTYPHIDGYHALGMMGKTFLGLAVFYGFLTLFDPASMDPTVCTCSIHMMVMEMVCPIHMMVMEMVMVYSY